MLCVEKNLNEKVNNEVFGLIPNVSRFMYNLIYRAFCVWKILMKKLTIKYSDLTLSTI